MSLLDSIQSPKDLKKMNRDELEQLCSEIRDLLVQTVSHNGGHLASNLGVVELTVALHRVFNSPSDPIIFDVGHQCYTHKILTGRKDDFFTLRTEGGISGFTRPDESEHDIFSSGHSSTAISQAIGLAKAKALRGEKGKVIAVIGDGAMTGSDGLLYRLLFNLTENAIKYNHPGGTVRLTVQKEAARLVIRVSDTGCGIPEKYRESIFQPFFRVDKSRSRENGGVGLGLSLVWEIVALHGGEVRVEESSEKGTTIAVKFPTDTKIK